MMVRVRPRTGRFRFAPCESTRNAPLEHFDITTRGRRRRRVIPGRTAFRSPPEVPRNARGRPNQAQKTCGLTPCLLGPKHMAIHPSVAGVVEEGGRNKSARVARNRGRSAGPSTQMGRGVPQAAPRSEERAPGTGKPR